MPNFPASSPFVTAVGGIYSNDFSGPEQSNNFTGDSISSGGFSNYFDMYFDLSSVLLMHS
jgi:subtilase family serine protease